MPVCGTLWYTLSVNTKDAEKWSGSLFGLTHRGAQFKRRRVSVLKDIGVGILALGPGNESELPFDYEGVNSFATSALVGISNWLSQVQREQSSAQLWPRAAELLPESSVCATTTLENILPTGYQDTNLNVTIHG
ncbi:hypothetical protein B0H19DRAFT_1055235 [Mycena capillaripes]|nr:hypothetical protein B0H19DRAFT_1055235 [Mycena capillaripes]